MKKRNRLFVCLVAGVLILAVSATAAYGSVNGYSKYKEAVKALALESDNLTAKGTLKATYDGKEILSLQEEYAMDGQNLSSHSISWEPNAQTRESYNTVLNGVRTIFDTDEDVYYEYEETYGGDTVTNNLLGVNTDDEMMNRLVNFTELAADTVVGELKNNFVQVGKEDGVTSYQVEIAKNQVPSLVNAGLSLFAYSVSHSVDYCMVSYENYNATLLNAYEQATGDILSEDFKKHYTEGFNGEWYEANQTTVDKVENYSFQEDWSEKYYDILNEKGHGIVYVKTDGSYTFYKDYPSFVEANPQEAANDIEQYVGDDMTLEKVLCNFGVDEAGNLVSNSIEVTFSTIGRDGNQHQLVLSGDLTVTDYGTTTVQPLDVGGREKYESKSAENN